MRAPDATDRPNLYCRERGLRARDQKTARLLGKTASTWSRDHRDQAVDETVYLEVKDGSLRLDRWFKRHYPGLGDGQLEKLAAHRIVSSTGIRLSC